MKIFSLTAKPGMHIAIVGPTGCGKTTMINLLMRFYDANQGDIRMEGTSIYKMTAIPCAGITAWCCRIPG